MSSHQDSPKVPEELLHDNEFAKAVHRVRRAVDPEALDEAVADLLDSAAPAILASLLSAEAIKAADAALIEGEAPGEPPPGAEQAIRAAIEQVGGGQG